MQALTVAQITSRKDPRFDWFLGSLRRQTGVECVTQIILVDFYAQPCDSWTERDVEERESGVFAAAKEYGFDNILEWIPCKPTVWQGPSRLPKHNWWAAANARNTAICMASGDFFACVDDRLVLSEQWMEGVRAAEKGKYVAVGAYQKRTAVTVENGVIKNAGIIIGEDNRIQYVKQHYRHLRNPYSCPGEWFYSASFALSMEWELKVNGFDESCDSSGGEDSIHGLMLQNNDFPIFYDTRMMVIEDRTPEFLGETMHRKDKGRSPEDKSHALLARLRGHKRSQHPWDIRTLRTNVQRGMSWPGATWPVSDFYDGEQVKDFMP